MPRSAVFRFGAPIVVIVLALAYLAYTGVQESKSYYVTIAELKQQSTQGEAIYNKRLRVAGDVIPGSIKRSGMKVDFALSENGNTLDRKSTRLNSSHIPLSRMPSS